MQYQITNKLDSHIYQDALSIRRRVFIEELRVPELREIDSDEGHCWHIVIYDDQGAPVATARLLPQGDFVKVQRIAVLEEHRGQRLGTEILQIATQKALLLGAKALKIRVRQSFIPYYQKFGYEQVGNLYLVGDVSHCDMLKRLTNEP